MTTDPPRLKPILKSPPPPSFIVGVQTPPRKRSDCSQLSDVTLIGSNCESVVAEDPCNKKTVQSLQTIKQKFMVKEPLPWEQYAIASSIVHAQPSTDYEDMIQQLNVSHALSVAFHFQTMSFVDADKLIEACILTRTKEKLLTEKWVIYKKKSEQLKQALETMYERLRVYTDTTRATIMTLKLDAPQNLHLCQLSEYTLNMEQLLDEFHFTNKYANHLQTSYLQHLAGTLCHRNESHADVFTSILTRLKSILEEDTSFPSPSSSTSSSRQSNPMDIPGQIDSIITKLSRRFKMNSFIDMSHKIGNTHDELIKQRERSASLVLELEKNRSQQRRSQTQNQEIVNLKEQLMQETLSRQELQGRVIELELALKKEQENQSKNKPHEPNHCLQEPVEQHVSKEGKVDWLITKKSILNQCYTGIDSRQDDLESVVQQLDQKMETLQSQEKVVLLENQALLETNLENANLLKSTQQELDQLKEDFNQILKLYNTRESGYILQSASTEAELERILKEYDRLTRNIKDFNHERKKFELEIRELYLENLQLSNELTNEKIQNIQGNDGNLRKEFRNLMTTVKKRHAQELVEALDNTRKVQQELRQKMSEIEMKRWEKVDVAVQTNIQFPF